MLADMTRFGAEATPKITGPNSDLWYGNHPMMWSAGPNSGIFWFFGLLWLITWVLIIASLIALIRWLWKKGDKVK
jgi:hypothetical protein